MSGPEVVNTSAGLVKGYELLGARAFKGIPYASAPRFRPARAPRPWTGVLDATTFGPAAPQLRVRQGLAMPGAYGALLNWPANEEQSESDCLVANVWAPAAPSEALRPVLFYVHGGQFVTGSGSWPMYDGATLAAQHGVVVVTFNYRLGVLGLLNLDDDRSQEAAIGPHLGFLDQLTALRWVQENIAAFGGDPANVTIAGSMAGGNSVVFMMVSPSARGLFHRAFVRAVDASVILGASRTSDDATITAELIQRELGIRPGDQQRLSDVAPDQLVAAQSAVMHADLLRANMAPFVDGTVIPRAPIEGLTDGVGSDVPLMLGCTRDEAMLTFASWSWGDDELAGSDGSTLERRRGGQSIDVVEAYRRAAPDASPEDLLVAMTSDAGYRAPMQKVASAHHAGSSSPTFLFLFCRQTPMLDYNRPVHALDVPYWLSTTHLVPLVGDHASAAPLSHAMGRSLSSFAQTGDPNCDSLPSWTPYEPGTRATMLLDDDSQTAIDPFPIPSELLAGIA